METIDGNTSSWRAPLRERVDAVAAAGSDSVVMETNGPERDIGEQCGGANPSSSQSYVFRVFRHARVVRSGRLEASTFNC
jgi:hypothetical protein